MPSAATISGAFEGAAVLGRQRDAVAAILEARHHGVGDELDRACCRQASSRTLCRSMR